MFNNLIGFHTDAIVHGPQIIANIKLPLFKHEIIPLTKTIVVTWGIMFVMVLLFIYCTRKLKIKPDKKRQIIIESIYAACELVTENFGEWKSYFLPYIGTLFMFLCAANTVMFFPIPWVSMKNSKFLIGPALFCPTADINTTMGLALVTFVLMIFYGLRTRGSHYLKEFVEPNPIMMPLEVVGQLVRPVNISMRLFGNMVSDMVILGLLYMFTSKVFGLFLIIIPFHLYFDLAIGIIQSLVFTMLTVGYISSSIANAKPDKII